MKRRLLSSLFTLLLLLVSVFFLLRLAPGGPFDGEKVWPPEVQANIDKRYGLDQPLVIQFMHWSARSITGDLGESFTYLDTPVRDIILDTLPKSVFLGASALLVALLFGGFLATLSVLKRNTLYERVAQAITVSGMTLPTYLSASFLILLFSLELHWLPPALATDWRGWILPVITLSLHPMSLISRLVRSSMLEVLASDYVRTALAKGASSKRIIFVHVLRNSLIPIVSLLGPIAANLVTGSFVVETVFQLPGMGKYFVSSVLNRDYPLVMGITLTYGTILIFANVVVDLLYPFVDPRIRKDEI